MFTKNLLKRTAVIFIIFTLLVGTAQPACAAHEAAMLEREMNIIVRANELDEGDIIVRANSTDGEEATTETPETEEPTTKEPTPPPAGEVPSGGKSGEEPAVEEPSEFLPWSSEALNADYSIVQGAKGAGVKVAVLDSGIDLYSELIPAGGIDLEDPEYCRGDDMTGHGTAVAGIIAAPEDEAGIIGIAPDAEIYVVRVLDSANEAPISRIIDGIDWCIENDIDIINMSFGTDDYSALLESKIIEARSAGILMVASAGNSADVQYPAAFDEVIAVGSVNSSMEKSDFSASGSELDFAAPGENVYSTSLIGGYSAYSGTSISAAHVTGAAAVIMGMDNTVSPDFVKALLTASAKPLGTVNEYGAGIPDLQYILENYSSFAAGYEEEEYIAPENTGSPETFEDDDVFVVGRWDKNGHNGLISSINNIADAETIKQVSLSCDNRDYLNSHPSNTSERKYFGSPSYHGTGNYVAAARLLYTIIREYKYNILFSDKNNFSQLLKVSEKISGDKNLQFILETDIPYMCKQYGATTNHEKATVVIGMLFHLLGDIYAHRSIVPTSSITYEDRTTEGNGAGGNEGKYFIKSHFYSDCNKHIVKPTYYEEYETIERKVTSKDLKASIQKVISSTSRDDFYNNVANMFIMFLYYFFDIAIGETIVITKKSSKNQTSADIKLLKLGTDIAQNVAGGNMCCVTHGCYGALKRLAGLGVLQFKDIKSFLNNDLGSYDDNRTYYEDKALGNDFYARRHLVSGSVIQKVFSDLSENKAFQPANLLPIYEPHIDRYYLKVDQLYNYLKDTNQVLDITTNAVLKESYWNNRGSSLFYYTTIVYNGNYLIDPATYESGNKPKYYNYTFPTEIGKSANSFYLN